MFITNGGCVENSTDGIPAPLPPRRVRTSSPVAVGTCGGASPQDPSFGHPDTFCYDPDATKWMSATVTTLDQRFRRTSKDLQARPVLRHVVTGGIVTVEDSNWLMSWTLNRQQQFRDQPKEQLCVWVYGLFPDKPGNYIKKPMRECTGEEICEEWLYHMGVPIDKIEALAKYHANTVPVMMPYIDAFFMPRSAG